MDRELLVDLTGRALKLARDKTTDLSPAEYRVDAHHWLILLGRYVCQARRPLCRQCTVTSWCDWYAAHGDGP